MPGSYGTPIFIHDRHVLDRKWVLLRQALPPDFDICYSVKANPNPAIVGHFLSKGSGLEIASAGEFHIALRAGCPPDRIMFAGPGKTENELEEVLSGGIGEIHAESGREVERIGAISRRLGVKARVAVRINPGEEAQGGAMRMGGKPSPFGVDEGELDPVLDLVSTTESIEFNGIHLFTGTQILDHATLLRQYRQGLDIARRVWKKVKRSLPVVDFGGGLGIPYYVNEKELDLDGFREGLLSMMAGIQGEEPFRGTRFVVEPGRFLVGESGVYLTRINDIKVSRGKKYVVVDGGMNHHLAASGNLGQVIRKNFPLGHREQTRRGTSRGCRCCGSVMHPPRRSGPGRSSSQAGDRRSRRHLSIGRVCANGKSPGISESPDARRGIGVRWKRPIDTAPRELR